MLKEHSRDLVKEKRVIGVALLTLITTIAH